MSQPLQHRARVADVQPGAVAAQTHAPVELILVDDESTDDSVAVAVAVALVQASGVPFKLLRQRNAGSSPALAAVRIAGVAARQGYAAGWQASTQFLALTSRHHHEREDCMRTCLLSSALPALHKQTDSSPRSTLGSRRSLSGSYLL